MQKGQGVRTSNFTSSKLGTNHFVKTQKLPMPFFPIGLGKKTP
jgi:hypothetical protein